MNENPDRIIHRATRLAGERSNAWVIVLILVMLVLLGALDAPGVPGW